MILVDSNVLIDYYRNRKSELAKKIDSLSIAICGVVKSEVLHGAKTNNEINNILASFGTFDLLHTDEYDFEGVGFMLQTLRENAIITSAKGSVIPFSRRVWSINPTPSKSYSSV